MLLSDYISDIRVLIHDISGIDWTDAELTTIVNNARRRVALDAHCVRRFYTNCQLIGGREIYPITGGVPTLTLLTGGTGYVSPTVTIAAPPAGGIQATATATATAGVITALTVTDWGGGYVSNPSVTIAGAPGVGATASATAMFDVLDTLSVSCLWPGNTQRYMLRWAPFTAFQAFCRVNTTQQRNPGAWTTHDETNQLFYFPPPNQQYTAEIDAVVLPTALVNPSDVDNQVLQPNADCVQFYGAFLALAKLQNFEMADYWRKIYIVRLREVKQTRQDRRIPNVYNNYFRRMNRW